MSIGVDEYVRLNLEEKIPEASKIVGMGKSAQSIIQKRSRIRQSSMSSSAYSPSQEVVFRLSSSGDMLDPTSASLNFNAVIVADANDAYFDDGAQVFLNRASLYINGQECETIQNLDKVVSAMIYSHMNKDSYRQGVDKGFWKWNDGLATAGVATGGAAADFFRTDEDGVAARLGALEQTSTTTTYALSLPLSYVFSLFRTNKLFPLAFVQNVEIRFLLNTNAAALVCGAGGASTYTITDAQVVYDSVQCSAEYMNLLDQTMRSADESMAYTLPLNVVSSVYQAVPGSGVTNVNFTVSTPALKSLLFGFYTTANDSSITAYSASGLIDPCASATDRRLRLNIGGKLYPEYDDLKNTRDVIDNNKNALGLVSHSGERVGVWDGNNFESATNGTFHLMYNFQKAHHMDEISHDGLNLSKSGANIVLQLNANASKSCLMCAEHLKVVKIMNGSLNVE